MFQKFFSCFNDSTENRQVDLSGAPQSINQFKPQLHPESNINGKAIDFNMTEQQSSNFLVNFKQSSDVIHDEEQRRQQQYVYEQEDGQLESKITTASPSKNQNYAPPTDNNPISTRDFYKQRMMSNRAGGSSPKNAVLSMTEKKLNNYLQQAKFLIAGAHPTDNEDQTQQAFKKTRNLSSEIVDIYANQNNYVSNNSSNVLFSAHQDGALSQSNSQGDESAELTESMMQNSYRNKLAAVSSQINIISNNEERKQKQQKITKTTTTVAKQTSEANLKVGTLKPSPFKKKFSKQQQSTSVVEYNKSASKQTTHPKLIEQYKLTTSSAFNAKQSISNKKQQPIKTTTATAITKVAPANYIIDELDYDVTGTENNNDADQSARDGTDEQPLRVRLQNSASKLSSITILASEQTNTIEQSQQNTSTNMQIHSNHKRKASTSETINNPLGSLLIKQKSNVKGGLGDVTSTILEVTINSQTASGKKTTKIQSHKKNKSTISQQATRNGQFQRKYTTTTNTPPVERVQQYNNNKSQSPLKKSTSITATVSGVYKNNDNLSQHKIFGLLETLEIKEAQNEDEDNQNNHERRQEGGGAGTPISPSSQSSFKYQPKFYKPTFLPAAQTLNRHSVSMDEQLMTTQLLLGTQKSIIAKGDLSKNKL